MAQSGDSKRPGAGSAVPIEAFVDDARELGVEAFEARHGAGFLLLAAARLKSPEGPGATAFRFLEEDEDPAGHTADLSTLVYPVRRSEQSVVHLLTVGRSPNNDVVIPDVSVSRFHAFLKRDEAGTFLIQDAGSTNGTLLNGRTVPSRGTGPACPVKSGDTLRVGRVEFTFVDVPIFRAYVLEAAD